MMHGTSLKRAKNILKVGFMDTSKMPRSMRECYGGIGEQDLTFFIRWWGLGNEKHEHEAGFLHHAVRVAKMDNDDPAVICARASPNILVEDKDAPWFNKDLKDLCTHMLDHGDKRWFRWYSIGVFDNYVSGALGSVARENLSMGEILRTMGIDAIMDGPNVVTIANTKCITSMEILPPNEFCVWSDFEVPEMKKKYPMSKEKLAECLKERSCKS